MKVHFLIESEQESAEREAVMDCNLYRGTPNHIQTAEMVRIPIRENRRPRNSEHADQIIFNAFFEKEHGVKDLRTRAMFCTNSFDDAKPYASGGPGEGSVVKVYPLKSAKIAFKPDSPDSLNFLEEIGGEFKGMMRNMFKLDHPNRNAISTLIHKLNGSDVTNCLEQVNTTVAALTDLAAGDDQLLQIIQNGLTRCQQLVQPYQVISATQVASAVPNSNPVELMLFDAAYFYAQLTSTDDETISGKDSDDDFSF